MFEYIPNIYFGCLFISVSCALGYKNFEDVGIQSMVSPTSEEPANTLFINSIRNARSTAEPSSIYSYNNNNESVGEDTMNKTEYYISEKYSYDYEKRAPLKSEDSDRSAFPSLHENRRPLNSFTNENNFQRFPPPNYHQIHLTKPYENHRNHGYPPQNWDRHQFPQYDRHVPPLPRYHHLPPSSHNQYPSPRYEDTSIYYDRETHPPHYYDSLHHGPPSTYRRPPPPHQGRWSPPEYNRRGPPDYERNPSHRFPSYQTHPRDYADRGNEFGHPPSISSLPRRDTQTQQDTKNGKDQFKPQDQLKENSDDKLAPSIHPNRTRSVEHSPESVAKKYDDKLTKLTLNKSISNTEAHHSIEESDFQSIIDVRFSDDPSDSVLNRNTTNVKYGEVSQHPPFYPFLLNFFQAVPVTPKC